MISIRSILTGFDESILPGLTDGEERIVGYYDDAIGESPSGSPTEVTLLRQRDIVRHKIEEMKRQRDQAA